MEWHDLSGLSILLVEDGSDMYELFLAGGLGDAQRAASAAAAAAKLRERPFDLIVCEYHLGEGQDGQHFLEDARVHELIPPHTIFIMVTAERAYERVVGAAEFAPSDYLLKPFSGRGLLERIGRCLERRNAFLPAYRRVERGDVNGAIAYCVEAETHHPQYAIEFMRLRAELCMQGGQPVQAQHIYAQVLRTRSLPWAKLGLAKTLFMQKRYAESERCLRKLIRECKHYLAAYDLLARVKEARGDLIDAQKVIEGAVAVSPHVVRRLKKLGEVAMENGDLEAAERALNIVVSKGKHSEFRDPEDHVKLVSALVRKGKTRRAEKVVEDLKRSMDGMKKTAFCSALSETLLFSHTGQEQKARESLNSAVASCKEDQDLGLSSDIKMELARSCLGHQLESEASELILDVMRHGDPPTMARAKAVLADAGHQRLADELGRRIRAEVITLIMDGMSKADEGRFTEAMAVMVEAARKMPGNTDVLLNAALAIMKYLDNSDWDDGLFAQARRYLDLAAGMDSSHPRVPVIAEYMQSVLRRRSPSTADSQAA